MSNETFIVHFWLRRTDSLLPCADECKSMVVLNNDDFISRWMLALNRVCRSEGKVLSENRNNSYAWQAWKYHGLRRGKNPRRSWVRYSRTHRSTRQRNWSEDHLVDCDCIQCRRRVSRRLDYLFYVGHCIYSLTQFGKVEDRRLKGKNVKSRCWLNTRRRERVCSLIFSCVSIVDQSEYLLGWDLPDTFISFSSNLYFWTMTRFAVPWPISIPVVVRIEAEGHDEESRVDEQRVEWDHIEYNR